MVNEGLSVHEKLLQNLEQRALGSPCLTSLPLLLPSPPTTLTRGTGGGGLTWMIPIEPGSHLTQEGRSVISWKRYLLPHDTALSLA